jgi:lipoyl(octanoyl) transferase
VNARIDLPTRISRLGLVDYEPIWRRMQRLTDERGPDTPDELWCLQHPPVFTQGMNGDPTHVLAPGDIPVIPIDRGGQVTYHGPGQLVVYVMLDLRRRGLVVRELVMALERAVIQTVAHWGVEAYPRRDAPGVYVADSKLASLGLRIRRNCSYHGLALNVEMDLEPFSRINPCGYQGMSVTQLRDLGVSAGLDEVADRLLDELVSSLALTGDRAAV